MNNNSSSMLTLSQGSLNKISNGEQILRPNLQVLDIIRTDASHYNLVVSDGDAMTVAILPTALNSVIENHQLNKFSIIEITSYTMQRSCIARGKSGMYILILRVEVKALGQTGSMRIGHPVHLLTLSPEKKSVAKQKQQQQKKKVYGKQIYEAPPSLSFGALQEIKKGEFFIRPVLQVLKIEKFNNYDGSSQYKLDVSDGQIMANFAFLHSQLDWLIASNQLSPYSVVEVIQYLIKPIKYNEEKPGPFIPQIMEILEMNIQVKDQEIDSVIGNPIPVLTNYETLFPCDEIEKQQALQLSTGILDLIMKRNKINKPILQVLGIELMKSAENDPRYRLVLSDGINVEHFSILDRKLNPLVANKALSEFTIIEATDYRLVNYYQKSTEQQTLLLVILELNIKTPGSIVGRKIVKPLVPIENKSLPQNEQHIIRQLKSEALKLDNELESLNQLVEEQKKINASLAEKRAESIEERNHLTTALQQQDLKNQDLMQENQQLTAETYIIQENLNDLYQQIQLQCQFLEYSEINRDIIESEINQKNSVVAATKYEIGVECEEEDDEYSFENISGFVKDFLAEKPHPNNNNDSPTPPPPPPPPASPSTEDTEQHYYQL